jgi:hypothetical protein
LCRILNMRGVNLNVFQFDYDLTWAAFFLNANEHIYGRFGGRDASSPDKYLTLAGLKHALRAALESHAKKAGEAPRQQAGESFTVERYPAAKRVKDDACIHCHQVWDFRREDLKAKGKWSRDDIWIYPLPENVGLTLSRDEQNRVKAVSAFNSSAGRAGLKPGDVLLQMGGQPVASFADVQHTLHRAPAEGQLAIAWERGGQKLEGVLELAKGWRESDISWRESMWGLEPAPCVYGQDLSAEEKQKLGLEPTRLAFKQGKFVPAPARMAGIREGDIILGINDRKLAMTMLQFNAWVRLNFQVGDKITFNILRDGKRMEIPMTLPARASF